MIIHTEGVVNAHRNSWACRDLHSARIIFAASKWMLVHFDLGDNVCKGWVRIAHAEITIQGVSPVYVHAKQGTFTTVCKYVNPYVYAYEQYSDADYDQA